MSVPAAQINVIHGMISPLSNVTKSSPASTALVLVSTLTPTLFR